MSKVLTVVIMAMLAAVMFCRLAGAEWQPSMSAPVVKGVPDNVTDFGGGESIDVRPMAGGDRFQISLYGVKLTSKGVDRPYEAENVRVCSGILDAAKVAGNKKVASEYVAEGRPVNGEMVFNLANYAKTAGVPVVEHLWGIGRSAGDNGVKYLILNPASQWVIYEGGSQPDLETLAIGILMCPNGTAVPLKSLGKGKLKQGKHPELADACSEQKLSLDLEMKVK